MNNAAAAHAAHVITEVHDGIEHEFLVCDDTQIVGTSMSLPNGDILDFGLINRQDSGSGTLVAGRLRRTNEFAFATFVNIN